MPPHSESTRCHGAVERNAQIKTQWRVRLVLAFLHIILGVIVLALSNSLRRNLPESDWSVWFGIFSGLCFILTGCVGVLSSKAPKLQAAHVILDFTVLGLTITGTVYAVRAVVSTAKNEEFKLKLSLLFLFIIQFVVAIITILWSIKGCFEREQGAVNRPRLQRPSAAVSGARRPAVTDAGTGNFQRAPEQAVYAVTVALPSTSLPSVALPSTSLPSVSLPSTSLPSTSLPSASLTRTSLPSVSLPSVSLPGVSLPSVSLPGASLPDVSLPSVSLPGVSLPDVSLPSVSLPSTSLPSASLPSTSLPSVSCQPTHSQANSFMVESSVSCIWLEHLSEREHTATRTFSNRFVANTSNRDSSRGRAPASASVLFQDAPPSYELCLRLAAIRFSSPYYGASPSLTSGSRRSASAVAMVTDALPPYERCQQMSTSMSNLARSDAQTRASATAHRVTFSANPLTGFAPGIVRYAATSASDEVPPPSYDSLMEPRV